MTKSKIYTRTGDRGKTTLVGGHKVSKTDIRLEAYGTVDELNAFLGTLIQELHSHPEAELLRFVQNRLFNIGSYLATDVSLTPLREASLLKDEDVEVLEESIDRVDSLLPPLTNFILPGGCAEAAVAHVCRTICRRAERRICDVASEYPVDANILCFINRLSDYLFVLSRLLNVEKHQSEFFWEKE